MAPPTKSYNETICGKVALMLPDYIQGCALGQAGCAMNVGEHWVLIFPSNSPKILAHEKEHACGMTHSAWVAPSLWSQCAEVLDGGQTERKRGELLCVSMLSEVSVVQDAKLLSRTRELAAEKEKSEAPLSRAKNAGSGKVE
jgi:hypothetical protein